MGGDTVIIAWTFFIVLALLALFSAVLAVVAYVNVDEALSVALTFVALILTEFTSIPAQYIFGS